MAYGHGKVILFGEHSVVHGRPALAKAVPNGAEVTAAPSTSAETSLHIAPWDVHIDAGAAPNVGREKLQSALKIARAFYADEIELALRADVRLPGGAGMGSSAALGVAVLRAMDEARGLTRPEHEIFERSLAWERVFHGNPSGVDNAMATYGGLALFRRGPEPLSERLTPFVPRHAPRLLAGYSGPSPSTEKMVKGVADLLARKPEETSKQFDAIAAIVNNGKLALEQGEMKSLGQLMTMNHMILAGYFLLSTPEIETMIRAAKAAGALGAKVTGGGGGGCMIALVDNDSSYAAVKAALGALGPVYDV
jgi:mevalonate kinase